MIKKMIIRNYKVPKMSIKHGMYIMCVLVCRHTRKHINSIYSNLQIMKEMKSGNSFGTKPEINNQSMNP